MKIESWKDFACGLASGVAVAAIGTYGLYAINKTNRSKASKSIGISATKVRGLVMDNVKVEGYSEGGIAMEGSEKVDTKNISVSSSNHAATLIISSFSRHHGSNNDIPQEKKQLCDELKSMIDSLRPK